MREDTILVSIMHVNNEIGVVQDIEAIGELTRARKILFHVDAAQSAGKVPIDLEQAEGRPDVLLGSQDLRSQGHRRPLCAPQAPRASGGQMHGGGHERGMRSGTLATHQIVGMGEAFRIAGRGDGRRERARACPAPAPVGRARGYGAGVPERRCGAACAGNLNVSFAFVEGESLIMALKDLAVSSGSACTSASLEPSYVLRALGREDELAHSSIRFTLGRFTTAEEVDYAVAKIREQVERCASFHPCGTCIKDGIDLSSVQWAAH